MFRWNVVMVSVALIATMSACHRETPPKATTPQPLPATFAEQLQQLKAQLPIHIQGVMTLSQVETQGMGVHYTYHITSPAIDPSNLQPDELALAYSTLFCNDATIQEALQQGYRMHSHYRFEQHSPIEVVFDLKDCPSQ